MRSRNNYNFKLPMILSVLMLSIFVAYFLVSEFQKAKSVIQGEQRERIYEMIFTSIDTLHGDDVFPTGRGSVQWVKDTMGSSVSYTLSLVASETPGDSQTFVKHTRINNEVVEERIFGGDHNLEIFLFDENSDSIRHPFGNLALRDSLRFSSAFGDSVLDKSESVEMIKILAGKDETKTILPESDVLVSDIIKRIWPQILFSVLLLLVTILSFYMISRSLQKERMLSELRNDFMSNMSHELKTPVSTISVALEALSRFDAADKQELRKEYIDISRKEVDRLGLLVDKTLNLNLFEQGKIICNNQRFDLREELEKVVEIMKVSLEQRNADIQLSYEGTNFHMYADKSHMINVIYNLIENAIKYSKDRAEIRVNVKDVNQQIIIEVCDNGIGIAEEYHANVFDKFFRVPKGDVHNVKGHGLGLSYVKKVVESLSGRIELESEVGKGSCFRLFFPKN